VITVDTNIYISAFKFGRKPMELLEMAARGEIEIAVSQEIIDETLGVLRDKFAFSRESP
jgi:predicted nucleic acid-binding protein